MSRRRRAHALRRRYGRADLRKAWSMLHRGEHMGFIHAHDRAEACAIARDSAPPSWRKSDIDVRAAHGHARRRYGHAHDYDAFRGILLEARSQGATHFDAKDLFGHPTVYREAGHEKWQAALIKPSSGGGYHVTAWQWAPFDAGPRGAGVMTISDAIRRAA